MSPKLYKAKVGNQTFSRMSKIENGMSVAWTHVIVVKVMGSGAWIDAGWATSYDKAKKRISSVKRKYGSADIKIIECY